MSYCSQTKRVTILFSTLDQHKNDRLDKDDVKMRPQFVQFDNHTKRGVDTIDKMHGQYTTARISRCWPLAVFFAMLDIGGINVTVLYQLNRDEKVTRQICLRNLTRSLVMEHVQHCLTIDQTPVKIKR